MNKKKISLYIILFSFLISIFVSQYNIENFDKNIYTDEGIIFHQMIKSDPYRYLSEGYDIKKEWDDGVSFFKSGPDNYTKYLPSRIAALYYYIFDYEFYNDENIQATVKTGNHNFYLFFQCFFYFLSLFIFSKSIYPLIKNNFISNIIIIFLCMEPTIFQYHTSFWSESYFFSFQLLLLSFMFKSQNLKNLMFVGFFLGILALQKQVAFFYIIPILLYYLYFIQKSKIGKMLLIFSSYFLILSILGFNNLGRTGKFFILTADTKNMLHLYLVEHVMMKKNKITGNEFRIAEGKIMYEWIKTNNINYDKSKIDSKKDYSYFIYRDAIIDEKDVISFDNEISVRSIEYIKKYPIDVSKFVIKKGIHTILLNPFHIYSDNNFESGEVYYTTKQHDNLVYYRIPYSFIIYSICILGFVNLLKQKKYNIIALLIVSIIYFYSLVMWHGNTRYFVPNLIYMSIFFGYGASFIKDRLETKLKKRII